MNNNNEQVKRIIEVWQEATGTNLQDCKERLIKGEAPGELIFLLDDLLSALSDENDDW